MGERQVRVVRWHAEPGPDRPLVELQPAPGAGVADGADSAVGLLRAAALATVTLTWDPVDGSQEHPQVTLAVCAWPAGSPGSTVTVSVCAGCDGPILTAIVERRVGFLRFHDDRAGQVTVPFTLLDPAQAAADVAAAQAAEHAGPLR